MGGFTRTHKGLWIRLETPGAHRCAPTQGPLPGFGFQQPSRGSAAFTLYFCSHPLPQGTQHNTSFLNPPPRSVLPGAGCTGSLRPPLRPACPAPPLLPLGLGLFSRLSFLLLPSSPAHTELQLPKEGSPETSAGGSRKGNLKLPLRRLNFFPKIYTGIKLRHPQLALQAHSLF